jgi:hypothetical protein
MFACELEDTFQRKTYYYLILENFAKGFLKSAPE